MKSMKGGFLIFWKNFILYALFHLFLVNIFWTFFRHLLYNIVVENEEQAKLVNGLENQIPIDIWMYAMPGRPGQILVSKEDRRQFVDAVENAGIAYTVLTENIRE